MTARNKGRARLSLHEHSSTQVLSAMLLPSRLTNPAAQTYPGKKRLRPATDLQRRWKFSAGRQCISQAPNIAYNCHAQVVYKRRRPSRLGGRFFALP
jgi:hypothetical protein